MAPALLPGDWLLLDPTGRRWLRPGSIVVICEPDTGILAIKRVAARGGADGGPAAGGLGMGGLAAGGLAAGGPAAGSSSASGPPTAPVGPGGRLEPREAWLLGDTPAGSLDSRRYGPLDADALVARAWFRYGPPGRIGRLR